jgi:2-keto-3-deoxy-L-rhamnonate aldolase RhmA
MIFKNRVKQALREGKVVFGPMVSEIRSPGIALLFAQAGFDFFFIDTEHGPFTTETVSDMILAARAAGISPIVRPPGKGPSDYLSRPLDSGADGLLIPQIQTREDVENIVKWCRYSPVGERGMALSRQHTFFEGGQAQETMNQLNEEVLLVLQIEHRDALENLPELLSVPGIDVAFVGPADLSASLGKPGRADDPEVVRAIERVIEVSREHGVIPGVHTDSLKKAKYWIDGGARMVGFYTDIKLILEISKSHARELRTHIDEAACKGKAEGKTG